MEKTDPEGFSSQVSIAPAIKAALRTAIKESGLSREMISDRMNTILSSMEICGSVTVDQINSWTKNEINRAIPIALLPVFCKATNSLFPFQALLYPLGAKIMDAKDKVYLELGKAYAARKAALKRESSALEQLGLNGNECVAPPEGSLED